MLTVGRKICVNCGRPCLESERACWACGSLQFVAPGEEDLIGERTVAVDDGREITLDWTREHRDWRPVCYVAAAAAFALLMCVIGFWLGRASRPDARAEADAVVTPRTAPVTLPTPPTGLSTAPSYAYDAGAASRLSSRPEPPLVTVRSQTRPLAAPRMGNRSPMVNTGSTRPPLPRGISPHPVVQRPPVAPQVTTRRSVTRFSSPTVPALPQEAAVTFSAPAPTSDSGVVLFRSNAPQTVEVSVDDDRWTVIVAPGGTASLSLPPGTYSVQASASGSTSGRSLLAVGGNRSYSLTIDGRQDGSRMALSLREPAIDGRTGN